MKLSYFIVICSALWLCSCSLHKPSQREYYAGEFVYFADAASMVDCATGERIVISNNGEYLDVERRYASLGMHGEAVFVEFYGHRTLEPPMEGDRMEPRLVVDSLIGFDNTVLCSPDAMVVGIYEGTTPADKYLVRLKPDYTYTQSVFAKGKGEVVYSGRWYMSASAEVVMIQSVPDYAASTFEFIPAQSSLVKNSGGKPLVLIKVYL